MPEGRTPLIAANWKMNKLRAEAAAFLDSLLPRAAGAGGGRGDRLPPVHGA